MKPLVTAAIVGTLVYLFDGWVLGQGALSLLVGAIAMLVAIAKGLAALLGKRSRAAAVQLAVALLWVSTMALTIVTVRFQASHAQARAETLVSACKAYKATNGVYPERLQDLVPRYLPSVPRAKYTLGFGEFLYHRSAHDEAMLMYTSIPPFLRTFYDFEKERWSTLD